MQMYGRFEIPARYIPKPSDLAEMLSLIYCIWYTWEMSRIISNVSLYICPVQYFVIKGICCVNIYCNGYHISNSFVTHFYWLSLLYCRHPDFYCPIMGKIFLFFCLGVGVLLTLVTQVGGFDLVNWKGSANPYQNPNHLYLFLSECKNKCAGLTCKACLNTFYDYCPAISYW